MTAEIASFHWNAFFSAGGPLARALGRFEPRVQQARMAEAVTEALSGGGHLAVEAGTGVGKSLAYLFPAALWAAENGKKVLVSTHTKALQEQLIHKDLPLVAEVLAGLGHDLRYALLMGVDNYLCVDRLRRAMGQGRELFEDDGAREVLSRLAAHAENADTGLRTRLPQAVPAPVWEQVRRDPDLCLGKNSPFSAGCLFQKDLARARAAHVLVVNHHLFFAGLPIPDIGPVIFDEAHTLEETAAQFLGVSVSHRALKRLLNEVHNPATGRGLLRRWPVRLAELSAMEKSLAELHASADAFFQGLHQRLGVRSGDAARLRRPLPPPNPLDGPLGRLAAMLTELLGRSASKEEETEIRSRRDRCVEFRARLSAFFSDLPADHAFWTEPERGGILSLKSAPVDVSETLRQTLFEAHAPVVLTSATLAAGGSMAPCKARLGLDQSRDLVLDSPFDYPTQAALFAAPDMPDPQKDGPAYESTTIEKLLDIIAWTPGGVFALFTSWKTLTSAHAKIQEAPLGRPLFKQGDAPPAELINAFKAAGNGVLFGTDTFWQGVDVPGAALSCVVIMRLPFASPSDPLEEARLEWLKERGAEPFRDYTLPKAVIKLRQGAGRLIRAASDRGAVVILDPRVGTKAYGRLFLQSLPPCRRVDEWQELRRFLASTNAA